MWKIGSLTEKTNKLGSKWTRKKAEKEGREINYALHPKIIQARKEIKVQPSENKLPTKIKWGFNEREEKIVSAADKNNYRSFLIKNN